MINCAALLQLITRNKKSESAYLPGYVAPGCIAHYSCESTRTR